MNIVILTDRYYPTPVSGAVLVYDLALELIDHNHDVLVLTADSNLSDDFTLTKENNIKVLRVKTKNQKKLNKPARLLFELVLQRKIFNAIKKSDLDFKIDILIAHSPTIFLL